MASIALLTITGEHTGQTLRTGIEYLAATLYALQNGFISCGREEYTTADALEALKVGESWKSHEGNRGIKITRTS